LQSKKDARRFQNRRFPLPVSTDQKIEPRRKLDSERFEAAKISKVQFS